MISPVLERLVDAYPDDVQFVYRHFPLFTIHDHAQKSAEAAEAAGAQGKFWEFTQLLFERQREWADLNVDEARDYFVDLAAELSLDEAMFAQELDEGKYAGYVAALTQEAMNLDISGTPTLILDGRIISQGLPQELDPWIPYVEGRIAVKALADRQYDAPPPMAIDENATYLATIKMENGGEFTIELYPQSAPLTVNSFVFLANEGWFNGVTFHRVLPGFVAQTGDPSGTGMGDPGYTIPNEIDAELTHADTGMVAMANSGPDTNGSQWYITLDDASQLDGSYTIFGRVIEGMDVVQAIAPRDPSQNPNLPPGDMIVSVTIEEK